MLIRKNLYKILAKNLYISYYILFVIKMPWGRGFGWGWYGYGWMPWAGWGRGNPYPFCRRFPWLPRGWWRMPYGYAYPYYTPYTAYPWYPYWQYYPW